MLQGALSCDDVCEKEVASAKGEPSSRKSSAEDW